MEAPPTRRHRDLLILRLECRLSQVPAQPRDRIRIKPLRRQHIHDLNFADGDTLQFRLFEPGTFDDAVDPANPLQTSGFGRTTTFNSLADITEAHLNGVLQASDPGGRDTLLTVSTLGDQVSVTLSGIQFTSLNIPAQPPSDPSPGDDKLIGSSSDNIMLGHGRNDSILMRYGNDTAAGGTGAYQFMLDGRYVSDSDSHRLLT